MRSRGSTHQRRRTEMATPIIKLVLIRPTEAWHKLSEAERADLSAKAKEALGKVGGQWVVMGDSLWSSEQWPRFVVEKYPDIEAAQKYAKALLDLGWFRYAESMSVLGTEFQEG
jgi:hypothetical protein